MKFLILFISLLAQYKLPLPQRSTRSRSFARWLGFFQPQQWFMRLPRHLKFALIVVLPTLLMAFAFWYLDRFLWGLISFALEILLLLYVLSHSGIERHLKEYQNDLKSGDTQGAFLCAEQYLAVPEASVSEDADNLNQQVIKALMHRWFEYFFLMVFWYMVADVAGVLLAWFSVQYARASDCDEKAGRYLHWLEWIPARLLGLTYGLAGNFMRALPVWQSYLWQLNANSADVLFQVACSALSNNGEQRTWHSIAEGGETAAQELQEWQQLHMRSVSVWMVMIAAATVGGILL
ncbi:regulatory signaling modulator protein AmpE [Thalassolituus sp. LLYu03]|uniref:regulatory signaling modulator protein AmpE n=1 Tax=Thalassolituus sp. LLYu03 TaxID=3421656 RepID=UPI003D273671